MNSFLVKKQRLVNFCSYNSFPACGRTSKPIRAVFLVCILFPATKVAVYYLPSLRDYLLFSFHRVHPVKPCEAGATKLLFHRVNTYLLSLYLKSFSSSPSLPVTLSPGLKVPQSSIFSAGVLWTIVNCKFHHSHFITHPSICPLRHALCPLTSWVCRLPTARPNARLNERIHSFGQVPFGTGGETSYWRLLTVDWRLLPFLNLFLCHNANCSFNRISAIPLPQFIHRQV